MRCGWCRQHHLKLIAPGPSDGPPALLEALDVADNRETFGNVRAGGPTGLHHDQGAANTLGLVRPWRRA
jgi:hypothetical protein